MPLFDAKCRIKVTVQLQMMNFQTFPCIINLKKNINNTYSSRVKTSFFLSFWHMEQMLMTDKKKHLYYDNEIILLRSETNIKISVTVVWKFVHPWNWIVAKTKQMKTHDMLGKFKLSINHFMHLNVEIVKFHACSSY